MTEHVLDAGQIEAFLQARFPQAVGFVAITAVGGGQLTVRLQTSERQLRPGGTISGPTLMAMADTAMYYLVLSLVGPVELAVTTNLNINFLRRPKPGALEAVATLLKRGRQLVVGEVHIRAEGETDAVAHATVTYALPPPTPTV